MNSTMTATTTVAKSVLQKPLHQLTEDDISQLTREDCRRYLKDKGLSSFFSWFSGILFYYLIIGIKTLNYNYKLTDRYAKTFLE